MTDDFFTPSHPEYLEKYTFQITQEWETTTGVGFVGVVSTGEEPAFIAENLGNGGCNRYATFDQPSQDLYKQFQEDCKKAYEGTNHFELEDTALIWIEVRDLAESK